MKQYNKPVMEYIALRTEERLAQSGCTVYYSLGNPGESCSNSGIPYWVGNQG